MTAIGATNVIKRDPNRQYYTLHFPRGHLDDTSAEAASIIADTLGARYEGPVGELKTYFVVSRPLSLLERREEDEMLVAFEEHKHRNQAKRDLTWAKVERMDKQIPRQRTKRAPVQEPHDNKLALKEAQRLFHIEDPGFSQQWHLINQKYFGKDVNVTGVWKQGITGNGSIVVILDDGLDYESVDLADNFFAAGSYDFNDHVDLPKPRLFDDNHGTRCAGQIAAVRNKACGVGIAYDAKVAGVRILSGEITDVDEAAALNYKFQENQIYSCSWGPPDNGETMEAPDGILADAFINGIQNGRGGKGSVYVFATGNGAQSGDNCNFDGYTNSIYTITVGAIDHTDNHPQYSESCSAQLVVTYSSGGGEYIYTTNVGKNDCADLHGGTSAAAPNAAGVFALVLSVRPELTWRDMQYLCVQTAVPINVQDNDWEALPSGRMFNHKYGYGKLDAYAIVEAAKTFELVNNQTHIAVAVAMNKTAIPDSSFVKNKKPLRSTVEVTEEMVKAAGLRRLEHITATVSIEHEQRGNLVINLESPSKVESQLATERRMDRSADGVKDWKFMSVKHWGENPVGNWTLFVYDVSSPDATGKLVNWTLTLFGEIDTDFEQEHAQPSSSHVVTLEPTEEHKTLKSTAVHPTATSTSDVMSTTIAETHVPTRPTKVKPKPTTHTTTSTATTSLNATQDNATHVDEVVPDAPESQENTSNSPSTAVYGLIGTGAILGLATGMYLYRRKGWRPPTLAAGEDTPHDMRADGYEFTELQPEDEDEEDRDHANTDSQPLLGGEAAKHEAGRQT
ncbi:pheromone processing endoprotease [Apophysomyces sp. BC1034]|nr:pheromone processing endoprotease [Apophysomyces sp. BC1015]KAG0170628.1 pheromone processing endoprotease [Apophysomyces sp. BC1021]KAG0184789.1 pheromone processing endoprotease [Apophysomyces sp. BC1034]